MSAVISSDVMGNRNVEVVPVGAWVEPANKYILQPDAVKSAQIAEENIRLLQEEKENRLKTFQQRVKQRVSQATKLRRQQQVEEAELAFEKERRVVQQSCLTADNARKDTCVVRHDMDLAIRNRLMQKYGEDVSNWNEEREEDFFSHSKASHEVHHNARQQLTSKKVSSSTDSITPVNTWNKVSHDIQTPTVSGYVPVENLKQAVSKMDELKSTESSVDGEEKVQEEEESDSEEEDGRESSRSQNSVPLSESTKTAGDRRKKKRPGIKRPTSARLQALLSQESEADIAARQRRQQAAVSRRVFMDREREAVRENIRRKQHRKKIVSLRAEKESYRQELEDLAQRELDPTDPCTGETLEEREVREQLEALEVKAMVEHRKQEIRRQREMERYLDALKHNLKEKVSRRGVSLPALCACGDSLWETNPDTCANNCFFYRNHRAYARALQSMLTSAEVM